jgi:hypothetical protein
MRVRQRTVLIVVSTVIALGMALVAQPTEFREHGAETAAGLRAHWVPGTDTPMSGFGPSARLAPMPH